MRSRQFVASTGLAIAVGLTAACTGGERDPGAHGNPDTTATAASDCRSMTSLSFIGGSKDGNEGSVNAKNTGKCAAVNELSSPSTPREIGHIASGASFIIDCVEYKGPSLRVWTNNELGRVSLDGSAVTQLLQDPVAASIPKCKPDLRV